MVDHVPSGGPSPDPRGDGVRIIKRSGTKHWGRPLTWVVVILVVVCVVSGAVLLWRKSSARAASSAGMDSNAIGDRGVIHSDEMIKNPGDGMMQDNASRLAAPDDISNYIAPGDAPPMADVIARLNRAGVNTGLGAFSPPGTSPPMVGLAVPEDFKLPEGYVRHYQATDDGQRIDPILMFSPDFEFLDGAGRPMRLPPNMVVPPNMAPPGLPIHLIKIPPPIAPQGAPG